MEEEDEAMSTAIRVFAHYLGVDLDTEEDLLPAVREGFYTLPKDWEVGIGEDEHAGIPYFYNSLTGESDWKHPKEEICFKKVRIARERKRERQASRGRANNRDRERDSSTSRRDGSVERPASRQEVAEVEAFDIVEDLEESSRPKSPPEKPGVAELQRNTQQSRMRDVSPAKNNEVAARGGAATGGFGMSSADFLDGDADSVTEKPNRNTSSTGGSARGIDNSMSPPLFKEMRDGSFQSPGADFDDPRDQRPVQRGGHSRQGSQGSDPRAGGTAKESGWAGGAGPSESVLGGRREERDREPLPAGRRDYNSAIHGQQDEERGRGDRERDTERDPYNERGRSAGRGGGGRGNGGGRGRGRGWDRDDRDYRDPRDREQQGRGDWGRDQSRGRNDREGRDRDRGRGRGFSPERDGDEDAGPVTHRSRTSDGPERESGRSSQDNGRGREQDRDYTHQRSSSVGASASVTHISEKERELRAEVDKYQVDVHKLGADNAELADKLASVRSKHAGELAALRDEVSRLELRLAEERRERKTVEDQVTQAHSEHHSKARDLEDVHEIRLREAVRKVRTEADEELREKLRGADRRHLEEADALRAEMALLKRRLEETQREADNSKRKITLSKADGKMEAQAEADALRVTLRESEEQERRQAQEMRRLREENASVQGRLVAALQAVQVANAESDALRATATTAVHDEQAQSGAVATALQRIQHLDTECAQLKAENIILRREKEAHLLEIRKLRGTADFSGERLSTTETEARRLKAQAQAEVSRLTSRATELEALVSVLRGQLDQASSHEAQAVREVQRSLDSAEAETARLKDRMADREVTEEALGARIKSHERELIRLQEVVFKKDRQIREEQEKGEGVQAQIDGIRRSYDQEVEMLKAALTKQKQATAELVQQQRKEMEHMEAEVAEKVPEMIASAVAQVEARCANKHNKDIADLKLAYELQRDKLKQENADLQSIYAEKEARQRLLQTDEKVELEKLRLANKSLQRRSEELEEQVLELRRQIRVASNNSVYSGMLGQGTGVRRGHANVPVNRSMNASYQGHGAVPRTSQDFSAMLEHSFDHVRGSGNGSFFHPPYDPRFDTENNENYYYDPQQHQQQQQFNASRGEEDAALAHTVSFINDQLAFMKRQISSSLQPPPSQGSAGTGAREGAASTTALVAADDAIDAINQSVFSARPASAPQSALSRVSAPAHHVTFSPEALFSSPQSKSHRRSRAGDSSSLQETLRAVHEPASSGRDAVEAVRESASDDTQEEVEVLDEPQRRPQRGSNSVHSAPAPSSSSRAVDRSYDVLSDVSYLDSSALGASMSAYSTSGYGGAARYGAPASRSSVPGLSDFSAISDGGYHEGYWRAKYIRSSKQ